MNNITTIINKLQHHYQLGTGVVLLRVEDYLRSIYVVEEAFSDKKIGFFNSVKGLYDKDKVNIKSSLSDVLSLTTIDYDIVFVEWINRHIDNSFKYVEYLNDLRINDNNKLIIGIIPNDYLLPPEIGEVEILTIPNPDKEEIKSYIWSIHEDNNQILRKVNIDKLTNSLLGFTASKIKELLDYELAFHSDKIKKLPNYLIDKIESEKKKLIGNIDGLEIIEIDGSEIVGYHRIKETITKLHNRELAYLNGKQVSPVKGVLLHGLPGVGKTEFSKYIAKTFNYPLLKLDIVSLYNKWQGVTESRLHNIFNTINNMDRSVILIDEIHLLFDTESRGEEVTKRLISMLQTYMSFNKNVIFVLTANDISNLPEAMLRKGRIDSIILVDKPNTTDRKEIINHYLSINNIQVDISDDLIGLTEKMSGSDIRWLVEEAVINCGEQLAEQDIVDIIKTNQFLEV